MQRPHRSALPFDDEFEFWKVAEEHIWSIFASKISTFNRDRTHVQVFIIYQIQMLYQLLYEGFLWKKVTFLVKFKNTLNLL